MNKTTHPLGLALVFALAPTVYAGDVPDIEKGRKQIEEATAFMGQQTEIIESKFRYSDDMPADNAAAGLEIAEDLYNKYIREIKVGETLFGDKMPGAVTATFYNDAPNVTGLRGKKMTLIPLNGRYKGCVSNIEQQYFPKYIDCAYISNPKELESYPGQMLIKEQVAEALNLAGGLKAAVVETYADRETWPQDNKEAGVADAFDMRGKYVKEVRIGVNLSEHKQPGVITATLYNEEPVAQELRGKKLSLEPRKEGNAYRWSCVSDIDSQHLPLSCRQIDK